MTQDKRFLAKKFLRLEGAEWLLALLITLYSAVFSHYLIMKFYSFRVGAWDLGILVQSIASASKGQLFKNNVELYYCPAGSYFGVHFSPILFILVPFFSIIPKVETILIMHTIILALGCIPVYLLAKHSFKNRTTALMFSFIYLLNPSLQGIIWYDITPQTFFPVLILSATYFLKKRKPIQFFIFLTLTLMTLEQASFFILIYTFYVAWELRTELKKTFDPACKYYWCLPLFSFILAVFWIFFSSSVKNIINPNPPEELFATENFRVLGVNNIIEIPAKILTDPYSLIEALHYDLSYKLFYILMTLAPTCFLCLLSPIALLPAFLWFFLAILSNWPPYYYIGFQYPAFTLPFIMIATIESLRGFSNGSNSQSYGLTKKMLAVMICLSLVISIFASPLSPLQKPGDFTNFRDYGITYPSSLDFTVMEVLKSLPPDAAIMTTTMIFPHLVTNTGTYIIPPIDIPSKRLYNNVISYLSKLKFDYIVIVYYYWDKPDANVLYNMFVGKNGEYGLYIYAPGLEVYKRHYRGDPQLLNARFSYKELSTWGKVVDDPTSESGKVIKFTSSIRGLHAWYGPYTCLLPGDYIAKFKIKVDSLQADGEIMKLEIWSNYLQRTIASYEIYGKDFSKTLTWHTFTLQFTLPARAADIEFRGLKVAENVTVWLDYVEVSPISLH